MENEKVIYSAVEAIFAKVVKRALNTTEMERLRAEARRMEQAIKSMAERQALEKCNKLNLATREAFRQVALDIKDLNERMDKVESDKLPPATTAKIESALGIAKSVKRKKAVKRE